MLARVIAVSSSVVVLMAACSGAVDGPGSTGTGMDECTTTTPSGTGPGTGMPTGTGCSDSLYYLRKAIDEAQACLPACDAPQCSGDTLIMDACGCPLVANDLWPELAERALSSYDSVMTYAPCSQVDCSSGCSVSPDTSWECDPDTQRCIPLD